DGEAAVGLAVEQTLIDQPLQGLADRGAADADLGGQLAFGGQTLDVVIAAADAMRQALGHSEIFSPGLCHDFEDTSKCPRFQQKSELLTTFAHIELKLPWSAGFCEI